MLQNVQKKERSKVGLLQGLQQELECLRWYFAAAIMQQVTVNPGNRVSGRINRESVESEGTLVKAPATQLRSGLREQHSMSVEGEAQEWCSGGWCSATKWVDVSPSPSLKSDGNTSDRLQTRGCVTAGVWLDLSNNNPVRLRIRSLFENFKSILYAI